MSNTLLYPNVSGAPGTVTTREPSQAPDRVVAREINSDIAKNHGISKTPEGANSFEQILGSELKPAVGSQVRDPLKFSAHASARMQSRKLEMGPEMMRRLNEAVDKAAAKGIDDALVLSSDGAFIVSVKNRTVVTAMDRGALDGNVFTNIDGAVVM